MDFQTYAEFFPSAYTADMTVPTSTWWQWGETRVHIAPRGCPGRRGAHDGDPRGWRLQRCTLARGGRGGRSGRRRGRRPRPRPAALRRH